jgi:peptide deformylase
MAVVPVVQIGDPKLAAPSEAVTEFATPKLRALTGDMLDTMRATNGVGIAAPQIGENLRVVIVGGFESNERYPGEAPVPLTIIVNPILAILDKTTENGWEGCLSVPEKQGLVPRYKTIGIKGFDIEGHPVALEASGFHARIWQHECDHLEGILFPQRAIEMRNKSDVLLDDNPSDLHDNS